MESIAVAEEFPDNVKATPSLQDNIANLRSIVEWDYFLKFSPIHKRIILACVVRNPQS